MGCLVPLLMLLMGVWLSTRTLIPPAVLSIAAGVLLRDLVLAVLRGVGNLLALPFHLVYSLISEARPRAGQRRGHHRRRYLRRRW